MPIDPKLLDEACDWHAALASDDADFDAFTDWLEASPDHAHAYDQVIELDDWHHRQSRALVYGTSRQ